MKNRTINIIALATLSVAVIGLMIYSFGTHGMLEEYRYSEETAREAVFEGLVSTAEKINTGLIKLRISNDPHKSGELLSDLWRNTAEAAALTDQAMLSDESRLELESFINVVGDYAHALEVKLNRGEAPDEEDRRQLELVSQTMENIVEKLNYARENGYSEDMDLDIFFAEQQQSFAAEEYPRLIYDGPFSESVRERKPRGLVSYSVTEQKALKVAENFAEKELFPVQHTDGTVLPFYNFEDETGNVRVSVTKQGGEVLYYKNQIETDGLSVLPTQKRISELEGYAEDFLEERGYSDCSVGWKNYYNGMAVLEMVPETEEGILLYPDIIKLWIDLQSGSVMGMDTRSYLMNHTEREFPMVKITREEAEAKLSDKLEVKDRFTAVIPKNDGTECLCYGFFCEEKEQEVLLFLNTETGAEEDILVVVREHAGEKTM